MAAIFVVSSLPSAPLPPGVSDTSGHWLAYAGLGALVTRALAGGFGRPVSARLAFAAFLVTAGYGATDEFHQGFVPGRFADRGDLYADAGGGAAAAGALWAWGIIRGRLQRLPDASHDEL
jgi:VanZ family protein